MLAAFPGAATLEVLGEFAEESNLIVRTQKVLGPAGTVVASSGPRPGVADDVVADFEALTDEIDPLLDWLGDLTGDDYLGAMALDLDVAYDPATATTWSEDPPAMSAIAGRTALDLAGASSALVAALEAAWSAIVARHPDELKLGHFAAGRWDVGGQDRPEVLVGGEGLRRGAVDVLGTLLHEAAHGLGLVRGVRSTSRGGRYHNRAFKGLATELGLDVAQDASRGWTDTTVPATTAAAYAEAVERLERALVLWRRAEVAGGRGRVSRNPKAYACDCGRRIRVAESTMAVGPILCGCCEGEFQCDA